MFVDKVCKINVSFVHVYNEHSNWHRFNYVLVEILAYLHTQSDRIYYKYLVLFRLVIFKHNIPLITKNSSKKILKKCNNRTHGDDESINSTISVV